MHLHELRTGPADPSLFRVENDHLALTFLPAIGGRLLSLRAVGREWLWHNPDYLDAELAFTSDRASWPDGSGGMSTWANVGGAKTWPAPQGWDGDLQWAGPPDRVLDAGEYTLDFRTVDGVAQLTMTSPADERSGLCIERQFTVPEGGTSFRQTNTFTNISDRAIRWAIWEVAQVDSTPDIASGSVEIRSSSPRVVDLGTHRGCLDVVKNAHGVVVPVQDVVIKRGFPDADGLVSYRDAAGHALHLAFTPTVAADYPDSGSRVELWMQAPQPEPMADLQGLHPTAWLVELEVLGPLTRLEPGTSTSLTIDWSVL